ncbi:glycerol-3-phosphate 1-O-acyltransferase PlsY [Eubacterium xylanophilum]|uniref:glycerol-3-phosphate 1-O-acyltransferase PlsY n=1 Tax=Eubacterium xylanophilum TaxID=39497 RepID=UPI0004AD3069|nr:glycerol-3-phosphate 1-O-acyltransferase PlsY [Eubacterium xylanophilum]MCR5797533.1 glycerol-3-phosphate 1-O-acyltransferase PlsY [Eubacterium sp.]
MDIVIKAVILLVIGYLFGCIPTGYLVGKAKGINIQAEGSGNIGATNALRSLGKGAAAITFIGDLLKAFIPMTIVKFVYCIHIYHFSADWTYLCTLCTGFGVVLGHNFPVTLKFKGGKGISVSAAVIIMSTLDPIFIGIGLAIFILAVAITRYVSVGSLIVVCYIPIYSIMHYRSCSDFPLILCVSLLFTLLAYIKHGANIKRLMNGTENKIGGKKE